jgi:hypothetical protein
VRVNHESLRPPYFPALSVAPPKSGVNSVLRPPTALYTSGALGLLRGQELKLRRLS